jgi:hypothetical protein
MIRRLFVLAAFCLLTGCGGGGNNPGSVVSPGGGSTSTGNNYATITVDAGPAALDTGPNGYVQDNVAYVSVTLCAPGTSNCQTIDHVQVDTGSVGLRIVQSVLSPSLLSALPKQTDTNGNPVGECFGYVDGYVFGSVRQADFKIGGETVSGMPFQVIGDDGAFAAIPSSCSAGGGASESTVQTLGSNGVIGIGVTTTDCGSFCASPGGYGAAIYYDCPASGCSGIIERTASASAPFQQLPNPVAMSQDNNGTILSLPSAPAGGEASMTGTLYFGIATQSNNALGAATVLTATNSSSDLGPGLITAVYKGQTLDESILDSGTSLLVFVDDTITPCAAGGYSGYYCPSSPLTLSVALQGLNSASAQTNLTLDDAETLLNTTYAVLPGLGGNPNLFSSGNSYPNSFIFGLPFFYGRSVYTAIEGRDAGGVTGPYFAF